MPLARQTSFRRASSRRPRAYGQCSAPVPKLLVVRAAKVRLFSIQVASHGTQMKSRICIANGGKSNSFYLFRISSQYESLRRYGKQTNATKRQTPVLQLAEACAVGH